MSSTEQNVFLEDLNKAQETLDKVFYHLDNCENPEIVCSDRIIKTLMGKVSAYTRSLESNFSYITKGDE